MYCMVTPFWPHRVILYYQGFKAFKDFFLYFFLCFFLLSFFPQRNIDQNPRLLGDYGNIMCYVLRCASLYLHHRMA